MAAVDQKTLVDELSKDWKKLWKDRFDDKVRAEGVAVMDYSKLFVDKGTVIHATRNYKALDFKDILKQHEIENAERYIPPNAAVGGWKKFVKDKVSPGSVHRSKRAEAYLSEQRRFVSVKPMQPKKGGRGWLHL